MNWTYWLGIVAMWVALIAIILWLISKGKQACSCDEYLRNDGNHERTCPKYEQYEHVSHPDKLPTVPIRKERPPQPLSLLDSLPAGNVRKYACECCDHILWTPGSHAEGCKHSMVHVDKEGWWFYDEIWVERYGPFPTQSECLEALRQYADCLSPDPMGDWHGRNV